MSGARGSRVFPVAFSPDQVPQIAAGEYWLPGVGVSGSSTILWAGQRGTNTLQTGVANEPTPVTGPGGNPAWLFASGSQVFDKGVPAGPLVATDGVYMAVWFRVDNPGVATFQACVSQHGTAGSKKWAFHRTASDRTLQVEWSDDGTNSLTSNLTCQEPEGGGGGLSTTLDKYLFAEVLIDPSKSTLATKTRLWLNGYEQTWSSQAGTGGAALFNGGIFRVGNSIFGVQDFEGQIGPIYIGTRVNGVLLPSNAHRRGLMEYRSPKDRRLQVICEGNSLTVGTGASVAAAAYPGVLRAALVTAGYPSRDTHNIGQGGITTQQLVDGFTSRTLPFYDGIYGRSVLVFFELYNSFTAAAQNAAQIQAQYLAYAARARAAGFFLIVCTAPPSVLGPRGVGIPGAVNAWIRANWQSFADSFVELETISQFTPPGSVANPTYYFDTVHLTDAGYALVAAAVQAAIIT